MWAAIALVTVLLPLAGCGGGGLGADTGVVTLAADDPAIAAARRQSQSRWSEFVASFRAARPGLVHDVKVALPAADGSSEHVWVEVDAIEGEAIEGTLANDPVRDLGIVFGDPVTVEQRDVEDWAVFRGDDLVRGGFSIDRTKAAREGARS